MERWDVRSPLTFGSPESVGLLTQPFKDLQTKAKGYLYPQQYPGTTCQEARPLYSGVTVLVAHRNTIVSHFSDGKALLYSNSSGSLLPDEDQIDTADDTIYDLASVSKLITTVLALDQIGQGTLDIKATVVSYIPEFATNEKSTVTIEQLMTHTSGFDADPDRPLYPHYSTYDSRRQACITQKLVNLPGMAYLYSDLNLLNLGFVLEIITGLSLDKLLEERLTKLLGMKDTFFNVGNRPAGDMIQHPRTAATEFQIQVLGDTEPPRPQPVRGTVHDENAWALNGVAGHAGIFSTAYDLAIFCQMILNNGTYAGVKILEPWTVDMIFHNYNTSFPGGEHGLGFELNRKRWAGPMMSPSTAGHTGFTGTSLWIDRSSWTFAIQLANRVHPSRQWSNIDISREFVGYFVAKALGKSPSEPVIE